MTMYCLKLAKAVKCWRKWYFTKWQCFMGGSHGFFSSNQSGNGRSILMVARGYEDITCNDGPQQMMFRIGGHHPQICVLNCFNLFLLITCLALIHFVPRWSVISWKLPTFKVGKWLQFAKNDGPTTGSSCSQMTSAQTPPIWWLFWDAYSPWTGTPYQLVQGDRK